MRNVELYIDLAFCLLVLPVMVAIFPIERWYHNFQWYVVSVGVWLYMLYFINRLLTVPALFRRSGWRWFGLLLIMLSFFVTYCFSHVTLYEVKPSIYDLGIDKVLPTAMQYQQAVWSLFMIVETFSFAVGLLTQANAQRSRRRAVEAERDKAEIELYKAQIKPHFMFNTLNSLYGLFLTGSENALPSLEKFIEMNRYIHTAGNRDLVPVSEEADYIAQYTALQSLRLSGMTTVDLRVDVADDEELMVPPMLLVTFVENCFKHGVSPSERCRIEIALTARDGCLLFSTSNRVFPSKRRSDNTGLGNCRKRLELLYPSRHELSVGQEGDYFKVKLQINLK